jgi:hypothetical protein
MNSTRISNGLLHVTGIAMILCLVSCVGRYQAAPMSSDDGDVLRGLEASTGKSLTLDTASGKVKGTLESVDHQHNSVVMTIPSNVFQHADTVVVPAAEIRGWRFGPPASTDIIFAASLAALVALLAAMPPLVVQ